MKHPCSARLLLPWILAGCQTLPGDRYAVTPQRPTLSSDTSTAAAGTLELEAGGAFLDAGAAALPMSLRYGAASATEVFASWSPFVQIDSAGSDTRGPGDIALGVRHRFAEEADGRPALAFQSVLKLPTGDEDRGLSSGEPDVLLAGILQKSVDEWTLVGFGELDFLGEQDGGFSFGQSLAFAAGRSLPGGFGVFGEVAGVFVPEFDSEQVFTTLGGTYSSHPSLVFDSAALIGLSDEAPDFGVLVGLTHNFGRIGARPMRAR